jgi:fatty-acyl-CoA synthase
VSAAVDHVGLQARLRPGALAARELAARDLATGRSWSYAQLDRSIACAVTVLGELGVARGDRVATLARNRVDLVILNLACARMGAIYAPLSWRLGPEELKGLIEDAEPRLLIGDASLDAAGLDGVSIDDFVRRVEAASPTPPTPFDPEQPSLILYTSGTSGRPKGVLMTEAALAETAQNFSLLGEVTPDSIFLCDAPMFHVIGLITTIRPAFLRGGTILVSDGFIPARTLERLGDPKLGVTHYFCVPQMAAALRAEPSFDPVRLRRLKAIFTGGAQHPASAVQAWLKDGIAIVDGYGMSEAGTVFGMPIDRNQIAGRPGSVGVAPPGVRSRIVDAGGRDVSPGELGELWLQGRNLTCGYWRRPEETSALFCEGWLRTGDVVRCDEDGFYWIVDRRKDMFISGGENVYPAEIEAALADHPAVAECAVVGWPDAQWGEVGRLFYVVRSGHAASSQDLLAAIRRRLAAYKTPKQAIQVDALPRNGAGKILKGELKSR